MSTVPPSITVPQAPQPITTAPDFEAAAVAGLPQWWRAGQQEAWTTYESATAPHRKNEAWRFADLTRIKLDGYQTGLPLRPESRAAIEATLQNRPVQLAAEAVYANDTLLHTQPLSPELAAQGVLFLTLAEALQKHEALLKKHFLTHETTLGAKKYQALHRAFVRAGVVLYIPRNVSVKLPIEVTYWLTEETAASFPHHLVIAEDNSSVELIIRYQAPQGIQGGFLAAVTDVYAQPGAKVRTVAVQNLGESALSFQINSTAVERDGHALSLGVNLGGHYSRTENKSRMLGAGSRSDMLSLTASHGTQEFDQRTYQEHVAPNTVSDLLYKNALADDSRTIFAGMISVDPGAQQTNAYQSNRNLLLSDTAEADSLPGLEIQANDVRCTHGATTGQISEEEMFYMAQRGIPRSVAKKLFVLGFFDEVLGRLGDEAIAAELHDLIEAKFARAAVL